MLIAYAELGEAVLNSGVDWGYPTLTKPFRGLGEALGAISEYEHRLGRPLISAIVVQSESRKPGAGFLGMLVKGLDPGSDPDAWVEEEQRRVAEFWSDEAPTRLFDATFTRIANVLAQIKKAL